MKILNSSNECYRCSYRCSVPNKNGDVYDAEALCRYLEEFAKGRITKIEVDGNYVNMEWEPEIVLNYITLDIKL